MMVAVAVTQRCQQCIRVHVMAAVELGASRAEILEAAGVVVAKSPADIGTAVLEAIRKHGK